MLDLHLAGAGRRKRDIIKRENIGAAISSNANNLNHKTSSCTIRQTTAVGCRQNLGYYQRCIIRP